MKREAEAELSSAYQVPLIGYMFKFRSKQIPCGLRVFSMRSEN